MDYGREKDLEELVEGIENARSTGEADYYKRIMYRICNESDDVRYWREELLKAVRANARDRKRYCIAMIQKIKSDETYGRSWGNNKGNRLVN